MMIAARLVGGNLFFAFFVVGGWGAARSTRSTRMIFQGGGVCFGL